MAQHEEALAIAGDRKSVGPDRRPVGGQPVEELAGASQREALLIIERHRVDGVVGGVVELAAIGAPLRLEAASRRAADRSRFLRGQVFAALGASAAASAAALLWLVLWNM